ncbi:MAG: VOC family protein, partial [Acidobacteriota bacterium]
MRHTPNPSSSSHWLLAISLLCLTVNACAGPEEAIPEDATSDSATPQGAAASDSEELVDPLAPKTSAEDALTHQLHTATLVVHQLDATRRFYAEGLGLELTGPIALDDATREIQRQLWGIPQDLGWQLHMLRRPGVEQTIQVRVLALDRETPLIHTTWDAREPGPFSLGFPADELEPWDTALREMGFESMNPMSRYQVPRPDGSEYGMHETIWKAPDYMHAVTLSRRDGMPQLGPVDAQTGRGGPVYSAQSIQDSDRVLAFYTDVLGFELRSDREWKSHGSKGALAVPDGTVFRFSILYAPGASHGHLLFIDFRDGALPDSGVAPRPPHRGLAAWTFPVRDLA